MPKTADATLLPPPPDDLDSVRRLDSVGVETVLGAMIEQKRRASQPSFEAPRLELELDESEPDDADAEGAAPARRAPANSDAFLKSR